MYKTCFLQEKKEGRDRFPIPVREQQYSKRTNSIRAHSSLSLSLLLFDHFSLLSLPELVLRHLANTDGGRVGKEKFNGDYLRGELNRRKKCSENYHFVDFYCSFKYFYKEFL